MGVGCDGVGVEGGGGGSDTFKDDSYSPFVGSYCALDASFEFGLSKTFIERLNWITHKGYIEYVE